MRKSIVTALLMMSTTLSFSANAANNPPIIFCEACNTASDFFTYGAGYIFENHGGALAPLGNSDRVQVINRDTRVRYIIDVDNVDAALCFIYCFSYPPRGRWKIHYQRYGSSKKSSVETFVHVLRENYQRIRERNENIGLGLESLTWPIEAIVMDPAYNIRLNYTYRFDGYPELNTLFPQRPRPGNCWGTPTGVMCERY